MVESMNRWTVLSHSLNFCDALEFSRGRLVMLSLLDLLCLHTLLLACRVVLRFTHQRGLRCDVSGTY